VPDRIVRVGILTSDAVNRLTLGAEVFYRRLMNVVDDHGRYDGRTEILRAVLYPLRLERVSGPDIGKWIRETEEAALVRQYLVEGKPFLEIVKFGQKIRSRSKWPDPPASADSCQQLPADVPVVVDVVVCVDGAAKRGSRLPEDWRLTTEQIEWAIGAQPTWDAEHALKVCESFRDHWKSVPGSRGVKLDWDATWRNWVRREGPIRLKAEKREDFSGAVL
jgi:hypothetical protein